MSAIASGSRVITGYVAESTPGTTPGSPTLKTWRNNGFNINPKKTVQLSNEVRAKRQVFEARHGFNSVDGSVPCELAMQDFDDQIEAGMSGTWAAFTTTGINLGADQTTHSYTRASGSWITDGFRVGDVIVGTGFSASSGANNLQRTVVAVTASALTIDQTGTNGDLVTESSASSRTISVVGKRIDVGTVAPRCFTIERQFTDITQYQPFRGVAINTMKFSAQPDKLVMLEFGLVGMSFGAVSGSSVAGSAPTAPNDRSPFSAFQGVIERGASTLAVVTALDFTLDNQRSVVPVVGARTSPGVFEGTAQLTGTASLMFNSVTALNDFINENRAAIAIRLNDIGGTDFHKIRMPLVTFTTGEINPPVSGPIIQQFQFRGLFDTTAQTCLQWQRSNS